MEKINLLITLPFRAEHAGRLYNTEKYNAVYSACPSDSELAAAEVIIGMPKAPQLAKAKSLKWVQISSAGNDEYVNMPEFPKNAVLTNLSGAFGRSMSEFALTMTLCLYKHMHLYRDNQNIPVWRDEGRQLSPRGKKVLLLGAGNIAGETAELFKAFDCEITALRRHAKIKPAFPFDRFISISELEAELAKADIVICALPNTPETRGLLNRERLMLLKSSAVLINLGRGTLIDTDALADILAEGRILGAAVDVTYPEPLPLEHPLWKCKNAIITPHITGGSLGHLDETEKRLFDICSENLLRYAEGGQLLNVVDFEAGYRETENRY